MDFAVSRRNMVFNQIRANEVADDRLLAAFGELPRERFVPDQFRGVAYIDEDLPVKKGRYLMEPMVLAKLLQLAEIQPGDIVLDIGCATGYSAAVIARLANTVVALESDAELAARAAAALTELGADNAVVVVGPLAEGYPKQAPYDVIVFSGGAPRVPDSVARQLAEGGRMVIPVGERHFQQLYLLIKSGGVIRQEKIVDVRFVPMVDQRGKTY